MDQVWRSEKNLFAAALSIFIMDKDWFMCEIENEKAFAIS